MLTVMLYLLLSFCVCILVIAVGGLLLALVGCLLTPIAWGLEWICSKMHSRDTV